MDHVTKNTTGVVVVVPRGSTRDFWPSAGPPGLQAADCRAELKCCTTVDCIMETRSY
jgi:hypothetical protein